MLLLLTIGLVLVGAVSLVIGFASNAIGWIYLSIACSILAAAVLVLFSRMSRQPAASGATGGPSALPDSGEPTLATAAVDVGEPATEAVAVPEAVAVAGGAGGDAGFPIEDYDKLRVNEIVPQLSDLDRGQLEAVREREAAGKNRATVISRIDDLLDQLDAEPAAAAAAGVAGGGAELAAAEVGAATGAGVTAGASSAVAGPGAAGDELDNIDDLIEDYDNLSVDEILPLLSELNEDELEDVAAYEEDHQNRDAVLDRIDAILDGEEIPLPAPAKKSAAKKSAAKKTAAKKTAATKAVAKKVAAARTAAAGVKKASPKAAAAAKKSATKATSGTGAAAKKAAAKKTATPAKKAAKKTAKRA